MESQDNGASDKSDRAGGPADLSRDASQPKALIPSAELRECWLEGWDSKCGERYAHIEVSQPYQHSVLVTVTLPDGRYDDDELTETLWVRTRGQFDVTCRIESDGLYAYPKDFRPTKAADK